MISPNAVTEKKTSSESPSATRRKRTEGHSMSIAQQRRTRAPRFRVPNSEPAIIEIGDERLTATLDCLSLTGGRIRCARRFPPGTFGNLQARTVSGNFAATIELLYQAKPNTQAFRFVQMGPNSRSRLQDALAKMRTQGLEESQRSAWGRLLEVGRGLLKLTARK